MARPQKEGLDYFPLDVDIDQDDKVALIEAQHGLEGFGIVVKLLMKIYKNGYFYPWTEREQILFSKVVNVNINTLKEIVNDCIKWGLFSEKIYENQSVLTSKGIQLRYLEATSRRQTVKIEKKYLLICKGKVNEYKNLSIEGVNVDINPVEEVVNDDINPQSKVKESKEEKSKEKKPLRHKYEPCDMELAKLLFSRMLDNNPTTKEPNLEKWANEFRLIRERDERKEEHIRYMIDWCQADSFWKMNILSPSKLREKYDQLVLKAKEDYHRKNNNAPTNKPRAYQSLQDWADEE